jgi:hypothetical protein
VAGAIPFEQRIVGFGDGCAPVPQLIAINEIRREDEEIA